LDNRSTAATFSRLGRTPGGVPGAPGLFPPPEAAEPAELVADPPAAVPAVGVLGDAADATGGGDVDRTTMSSKLTRFFPPHCQKF